MQMYDTLTNLASSLGVSFDTAYVYTLFFAFAYVGGSCYLVGLALDVGRYAFRALRRLLRAIPRTVRRLLNGHFQKH